MGQTSYFKQKRSVTSANVCVTQWQQGSLWHYLERTETFVLGFVFFFVLALEQAINATLISLTFDFEPVGI